LKDNNASKELLLRIPLEIPKPNAPIVTLMTKSMRALSQSDRTQTDPLIKGMQKETISNRNKNHLSQLLELLMYTLYTLISFIRSYPLYAHILYTLNPIYAHTHPLYSHIRHLILFFYLISSVGLLRMLCVWLDQSPASVKAFLSSSTYPPCLKGVFVFDLWRRILTS
jgi:hypothetical protein